MEKSFQVPINLLQQIVNYIQTKPWNEVQSIMTQLQALVAEDVKNDGAIGNSGGSTTGDTPVS